MDVLKHHSEKIVNLVSTVDGQRKKLQELKKESVRAGLEKLGLVSADSFMPAERELKRKEMYIRYLKFFCLLLCFTFSVVSFFFCPK